MNPRLSAVNTILLASLAVVTADFCSKGSVEIDGNWFCQPVTAITYSNVGTAGSYNEITDMASTGICSSTPHAFAGPITPLDEEISFHFRGPLQLKQFAAYAPVSTANIRHASPAQIRRHGHQHQEYHKRANANNGAHGKYKRQELTATIGGQVVSWVNNWFGDTVATPAATASMTSSVQMVTATIDGQVVSWPNNWFGATVTSKSESTFAPTVGGQDGVENAVETPMPTATSELSATSSSATAPAIDNSTTYERIGYYNSASQTLDNLVFLGNYGGQGSGVFDENFGASLSYVNCDGTGGASSPQVLADTTIPSDSEVIIMAAQECSEGSCGYVRPGAVTYHGFPGADKVFMFEFAMPMDGRNGFNGDMPAIWALNANIPRTLQYGNAECSCWESGCGEFDIVEALDDGSTYLKSTLHTNAPGGDSDYFVRPISATRKLAVVFSSSSSTIHIQVLPDDTDFSSTISAGEIEGMCASSSDNLVSLLTIS